MGATTSHTVASQTDRPWSTSATIAAAIREGATLASERGGVFVLTLPSGEQLRAGRLQDLTQHLRLVVKRPSRKPLVTLALADEVVASLGIILDKGETITALCKAAITAECRRRRAEHEVLLHNADL